MRVHKQKPKTLWTAVCGQVGSLSNRWDRVTCKNCLKKHETEKAVSDRKTAR